MFLKRNQPITIKEDRNFAIQIFIFTVLFLVTAIGVYLAFIVCDRSFLRCKDNIDGVAQHYPIYATIKHIISDIVSGKGFDFWSWSIGLGDDAFSTFEGRLFNPLTYIVVAFPEKYLDLGYNTMVVLSQYLSGLCFLIFAREVKLNEDRQLLGAMCYSFSGWVIMAPLTQGTFGIASIMLPLVILGTEKILKKKSPAVFILSVAAILTISFYFAYMIAIAVILFYVVRFFYYYKKSGIRTFVSTTAQFIGYGVVGILIAGVAVIQNISKLGGANTSMTTEAISVFNFSNYLTMPTGFFRMDRTLTGYSHMYLPVICILLIPLIVCCVRRSTAALLGVLLFIASLFPITGRVFNGFSYTTGRWYYIVIFFVVWAAMDVLEERPFKQKKCLIVVAVWLLLLGIWNIGICYYWLELISQNLVYCTIIGVGFGLVIIGLYWLKEFKAVKREYWKDRFHLIMNCLIVVILIGSIIGTCNMKFYPGVSDYLYSVAKNGELKEGFDQSPQRVIQTLQEQDGSFYRSDQVEGYFEKRTARVPTNENIYFGNRSIYTYFSTMDSSWHVFSKTFGNNAGYFDKAASYSNDNRSGLDFLMGVKYFLGNNATGKSGASDYAGYGFEYDQTIEGIDIFKNKYYMGLGTTYSQYITESELQQYSYLEREQILMQAAVVPDEYETNLKGIHHATSNELKTEVHEVEYEIKDEDNLIVNQNKIQVNYENGSFKLSLPKLEKCQIVISFDNLVREKCTYDRNLELKGMSKESFADRSPVINYIKRHSYEDDRMFDVKVKKDEFVKVARNREGKNQGFNDVRDYYINLGYYDEISGDVEVKITNSGDYTFDALNVYAIPMDTYEENAQILQEARVKVDSYEGDTIHGSVETNQESVLYFSILNNPGWSIYIDGQQVEKIDAVNIAFTGAKISEGTHQVELRYHTAGLKTGIVLMIIGIIILIVIIFITKRRKKIVL